MDYVGFINFWGFLPCVLAIIAIFLAKSAGSGSGWAALIGVLLIALAAWSFGAFTNASSFLGLVQKSPHANPQDVKAGLDVLSLWVLVLPAAIAGLGVNLISAWASK